jgi:hypothetical protein
MIGESIYTYITKEPMMSSIQMKNALATATAATIPVPTAPVASVAATAATAAVVPVAPAAPVPVFYPSMFDRWAIPF